VAVNPVNGDLWVGYEYTTGGAGCRGNVGLFSAAYGLATNSAPTKAFWFSNSNEFDSRVAYAPANGGTLFAVSATSSTALDFVTGVDSSTGGLVTPTGTLSPVASGNGSALAAGNSLVIETVQINSINEWSTSSLSGPAAKTVANAGSSNAYHVIGYVP
jgi:hypothetical protein